MLVLVVREVVQLVQDDRPADSAAVLLVLVRDLRVEHRIVGIPAAVAEIADEGAGERVGARLGDRVHLHAGGAPLRCVEPVRDELKLPNRILAVPGLVAGAEVRRDLQTVDVELELAHVHAILHRQRTLGVRAIARRQQRQRHPVAPRGRQVLHLPRIDVAGQLG